MTSAATARQASSAGLESPREGTIGLPATVWIAITLAWTALVVDVVAETAGDDRGIVAFGSVVAETGPAATVWIVAALVASAAAGLAGAIGSAVRARRERRLAADLDARFDLLAAEEAAAIARRDQLADRVAALHRRIEDLSRSRQAIEDDLSRERRRVTELRLLRIRTVRELEVAARELDPDATLEIPEAEPTEPRG